MFEASRVPRAKMRAAHQEFHAKRRLPAPVGVAASPNLEPVLELGSSTFVLFQGAPYGVPPVGWRVSQELLVARARAEAASGADGQSLTAETLPQFYAALQELARIMWRHARPVGLVRRTLKRCGLLKNRFARGTEAELVALTDFFLRCRTRSSVIPLTTTDQRSSQMR